MTEEQGRVSISETLAVLLWQGQDFLLDQKKSQELTGKASIGESWEEIFKAKLAIQVLTEQHSGHGGIWGHDHSIFSHFVYNFVLPYWWSIYHPALLTPPGTWLKGL